MNIDFVTQIIKINNYHNIIVFINLRARFEFIKRIIKSSKRTILPPRITIQISITYFNKLSKDRDMFFEPQYSLPLKHINEIYAHVINASFRKIQIKNDTDQPIIIPRKARLNTLNKYKQNNCFFIKTHYIELIITD